MDDIQKIPEAIQWHEGMQIAQHHFQQAFTRQEGLLHYHLHRLTPFYWGVRKLQIDKASLSDGFFRISEFEAIMPDGTEVKYYPDEDKVMEFPLEESVDEIKKKGLLLYVAVAADKSADEGKSKGDVVRYKSIAGKLVTDQDSGESPIKIPRVRPMLYVLPDPSANYVFLPVARVIFKDANFALADFIPPCLEIDTGSMIHTFCADIAAKLRHKAVFLSDKMQMISPKFGMATVLETRDMIRSIVTMLPQLEVIHKTKGLHPYIVYHSLALLVGPLAALQPGLIPPPMKEYNHNDLLETFLFVKDHITDVLDKGINEAYTQIPFKHNAEENSFSIELKDEWYSRQIIIGVPVGESESKEDVTNWVGHAAIASAGAIKEVKGRRMLGAKRNKIEGTDTLVPLKGIILFEIIYDPEDKDCNIAKGDALVIESGSPIATGQPHEIVLYVKNQGETEQQDSDKE